jgi:hypothetical protein
MYFYRLIALLASVLLFSSHSCEKEATSAEKTEDVKETNLKNELPDQLNFRYSGNYSDLWRQVDSLEQDGLYRSALDIVQTIFQAAVEKDNAPQVVKCLMYKMKYNTYLEDDDFVLALNELNTLSETQSFPLKQLVHSITADAYWSYYQSNRWLFMNRSQTVNFELDDVRTWDLERILKHTRNHYLLSLENTDSLKAAQILDFKDILILHKNAEEQRPSLYDFLAHRALDYFVNDESGLTRSGDRFKITGKSYFSDETEFSGASLVPAGDSSNYGFAVRILQDLTDFHLLSSKPEPRVDLLIKRLKFAKNKSIDANKKSMYIDALKRSTSTFQKDLAVAEIYYEIASQLNENGDSYNGKNDEQRWLKKDALTICKTTLNDYPGSFGAEQCKALIEQIQSKHIQFKTEEAYLPGKKGNFLVEFRNIDSIYFRLVKLPWNFYFENNNYGEELVESILKKEVVSQWAVSTNNPGDHQLHRSELPITLPSHGHYAILASHKKSFSLENNAIVHTSLWASQISYVHRNTGAEDIELIVTDRENGGPLKGAKVTTYTRKYDYISRKYSLKAEGSYTSDANGMVKIGTKEDYRYVYVNITHQNDQYNNSHLIYQYAPYKGEKSYNSTHFFSDRSIYRPGQTFFFKGIRIHHDDEQHTVVPNKKVVVRLFDANYQMVSEQQLTTNEYGTFSGNFKLPEGTLNGQMYIEDEFNSHYFSVEEYKRPRFQIEMTPTAGEYRLNDSIFVKGVAKAYAGSSVDGAKVSYRVIRGCHFPYWYWYRGTYPYVAETEISNGTVTTQEDGSFTVPFVALDDPGVSRSQNPSFYYKVLIDVTDINGETQSTESWVRVGYNCLSLSLDIPNSIEKDNPFKFKLTANNLNYVPLPTVGQITIQRVIEPTRIQRTKLWSFQDIQHFDKASYEAQFENDAYEENTGLEQLGLSEIIETINFNTAVSDSVFLKKLKDQTPGRYKIISKAIDPFGEVVEDIRFITLLDKKSTKSPTKEIFLVNPLKVYTEPGEKAAFLLSSATKLKVFYEVEHKNVIVHSEWIELNDSQKLLEIPVTEAHRGNFTVHFSAVRMGRNFNHRFEVTVPHSDKVLDIEFETFRDKLLPGEKEKWRITIKGPRGEKVAAELLATMYDASLDAFRSNSFYLNVFQYNYSSRYWSSTSFGAKDGQAFQKNWNAYYSTPYRGYHELNRFGYNSYYGGHYYNLYSRTLSDGDMPMLAAESEAVGGVSTADVVQTVSRNKNDRSLEEKDAEQAQGNIRDEDNRNPNTGEIGGSNGFGDIQARKNFNETAFFYPELKTNEKGEIVIEFTAPESLTKWTILGLAHTKDLKTGIFQKELVTQKELMILSNAPRFLRENDEIYFSSKVSNLSEKDLVGEAVLQLIDPATDEVIDQLFQNLNSTQKFEVKKGQSTELNWKIKIPFGLNTVKYKVLAKSGSFSDGEEMILPILTNRMLVTESLPIWMRGEGTKEFRFDKLINSNSSTLKHHSLTLEYTSNPAWYAIQAMPYMMEYPYDCAEQVFTRFYANSLATEMMNSNPEIKAVFERWENESPESLLSNLEKNQELKSLLLEETPWVLEAQNESERKKRIGLLFNLSKMSRELDRTITKLEQMQVSNGGWPWFKGMEESWYITQHIVTGLGHLDELGVKDVRSDKRVWNMTKKAIAYLDKRMQEDYNYIKVHYPNFKDEQHLSSMHVQYLYARSFFKDVEYSSLSKEALLYYENQARTYWRQFNLYNEGMIALWANRNEQESFAQKIMASLRERAIESEELGMYWKDNVGGYYWYQAPIETQALLIEAFDEINNDAATVEALQIWLLKNKQTNDWKTTKATAEACYALLRRGTNLLTSESNTVITLGEHVIPTNNLGTNTEAGTGYFKLNWSGDDIQNSMGEVSVARTGSGIGWGAVYWQYFEDLDKITPHETPLSLKKALFKVVNTRNGPVITPVTENEKLNPGDKIKVRIELRSDRDMEYVHLKDMRASGLEPVNVFSGYRWQDGLSYYESTKDASTNFFIEFVRKGTYVFEYDLVVSHAGKFSNGISSIQCMYAPEFTSHSAGIRIEVAKE